MYSRAVTAAIKGTYFTTYSPSALMVREKWIKGRISTACGKANCIRPSHVVVIPWKKHMSRLAKWRRPQKRDSKGRFVHS